MSLEFFLNLSSFHFKLFFPIKIEHYFPILVYIYMYIYIYLWYSFQLIVNLNCLSLIQVMELYLKALKFVFNAVSLSDPFSFVISQQVIFKYR